MHRGSRQSSSTCQQSCRRGTFGRIARYRSVAGSHPRIVSPCPLVISRLPTHLQHLCDLEGNLVGLSQSTLSDQLHNLGQILLLLQNLLCTGTEVDETRVDFFVMGVEYFEVLGVRDAKKSVMTPQAWSGLAYFQSTDGKSKTSADTRELMLRCGTHVFAERDAWTNPSCGPSAYGSL